MLTIQIPPDLEARLTDLAPIGGQPPSYYLEKVLFDHLDELNEAFQDLEDLAEARQVRADIAAGRSSVHRLQDVEQALFHIDATCVSFPR